MTCILCQEKSGRYNMSQRCCQLRSIVNMPKARRQAYYQKIRIEQGVEASQALIEEVKATYQSSIQKPQREE